MAHKEALNNFTVLEKLLGETLKIQNKKLIYLVRHAQSLGNHAGSIVGWTDSKLSVKGRQDASKLFRGLHLNIKKFSHYHCSDLSRCQDTFNICSGFAGINPVLSNKLRQLNFGDQEGVHYDSMPEERKRIISSL